jgi:hypothetical protein
LIESTQYFGIVVILSASPDHPLMGRLPSNTWQARPGRSLSEPTDPLLPPSSRPQYRLAPVSCLAQPWAISLSFPPCPM